MTESSGRPSYDYDPDAGYVQADMVTHPISGNLVPAAELLDNVHAATRQQEIIEQDRSPRAETSQLSEEQLPHLAFELLMRLHESVTSHQPTAEVEGSEGQTVRTYYPTPLTTVQLCYSDATSDMPTFGNLAHMIIDDRQTREYYCQVRRSDTPQDGSSIYYDDYPYHNEDLGQPIRDTVGAYAGAQGLINQLQ